VPDALLLVRQIVLLALAIVCVYTDLSRNKIYNAVTLPALATGLILAILLDGAMAGHPHLIGSAIGILLGGGLLFLVHLAGGLGAGDVKLMAAVGALGGTWQFVVLALMYTALVGAAIAAGVLIWRGRFWRGLKDSARTLFTFRRSSRNDTPTITIPYGVAIGIGVLWAWLEMVV